VRSRQEALRSSGAEAFSPAALELTAEVEAGAARAVALPRSLRVAVESPPL